MQASFLYVTGSLFACYSLNLGFGLEDHFYSN